MVGEEIIPESNVWSMGQIYMFRVAKTLMEIDRLKMIAQYGTDDINDYSIPDEFKPQKRVEALYRIKDNLKTIFQITRFKIKKDDVFLFEILRTRVNNAERLMNEPNGVYEIKTNFVAHKKEMQINEEFFSIVFNELSDVEEKLNSPLDRAGFIYHNSGEMSFDEIVKQIEEYG